MKKMRLFQRTFFYLSVLFGIVILIAHLAMYLFLPSFYTKNMQRELENQAVTLKEAIQELDAEAVPNMLSSYGERNQLGILAEVNGVSYSYQKGEIQLYNLYEDMDQIRVNGVQNEESILINYQETKSRDQGTVLFQLMASKRPIQNAKKVTLSILPFSILLSLLVALGFSYFYSKKITKPILELIDATKQMEQHTAELERSKVEFLRAASHELKTPLAALRILLENMQYNVGKYKDHAFYLAKGIEQVDDLTIMVKEILDISRGQNPVGTEAATEVSVKEEIRKVLRKYQLQAQAKGLGFQLNLEDLVTIFIDQEAFQKVLTNLISNAVRYSREKGTIVIQRNGNKIQIKNPCTPLAPEDRQQVFEAFYRPDFARNQEKGGNGLGLYIVRLNLERWNIPYSFEPYENGMCFEMDLSACLKK